ncbi:isoprenylcysteine carboxyl methyltransferase, partial [Chelydra serpentina]
SSQLKTSFIQVLLCNPVCVVGYTLASWRFFRERIE